MFLLIIALLVIVTANAHGSDAAPVLRWGKDGHENVGYIAQKLLTEHAWKRVSTILGDDSDMAMASVGPWADEVRHTHGYGWSAPLHYINIPDGDCSFVYTRDCKRNQCVAGAIVNYTQRISEEGSEQLEEAMKFLIHFVGDIHQPLHCGWTGDKGGNTIYGHYETHNNVNLHAVWDEYLIYTRIDRDFNKSWQDWGDALASNITADQQHEWTTCLSRMKSFGSSSLAMLKATFPCVAQWANESSKLACAFAYRDPTTDQLIENDFYLGDDYYNAVIDVVESQISKASVRLAYVINRVYDVYFG